MLHPCRPMTPKPWCVPNHDLRCPIFDLLISTCICVDFQVQAWLSIGAAPVLRRSALTVIDWRKQQCAVLKYLFFFILFFFLQQIQFSDRVLLITSCSWLASRWRLQINCCKPGVIIAVQRT